MKAVKKFDDILGLNANKLHLELSNRVHVNRFKTYAYNVFLNCCNLSNKGFLYMIHWVDSNSVHTR